MTDPASPIAKETLQTLDERVRRVDEDRWLSSRYAPPEARRTLIVLYAFTYELARIRLVVSDATIGAIRFQWWRDAVEEVRNGAVRQHDVVMALNGEILSGALTCDALDKLIDGHEAAFEAGDRSLEPEAALASLAARVLVPAHGWGQAIQTVAAHWAALRRGEAVGYGPVVDRAPSGIRPAIAHFRLRRGYASGKSQTALARRLSVLRAVMSGRV